MSRGYAYDAQGDRDAQQSPFAVTPPSPRHHASVRRQIATMVPAKCDQGAGPILARSLAPPSTFGAQPKRFSSAPPAVTTPYL